MKNKHTAVPKEAVTITPDTDLNDFDIDNGVSNELENILNVQRVIRKFKSSTVFFSKPILYINESPIIHPNTINIIQGPAGSHKSRLAEILCSVIIALVQSTDKFLGISRNAEHKYSLCYVDSERNTKDQFPFALQNIQVKAGYLKEDHPSNLDYLSIINVPREKRLNVLEEYIERQRDKIRDHWVLVFDVCSDFVTDFNRVDCSMALIDWMNKLINNFDITIICVIHENPGQNKARGHLGTELLNKSSTVIQITGNLPAGIPEDVYKVSFLKCRSSKRPPGFYTIYSDERKGLIVVPNEEIESLKCDTAKKALISDVISFLGEILSTEPISNTKMMELLVKQFEADAKTIRERLTKIREEKLEIELADGKRGYLVTVKKGREIFYLINEIDNPIDNAE